MAVLIWPHSTITESGPCPQGLFLWKCLIKFPTDFVLIVIFGFRMKCGVKWAIICPDSPPWLNLGNFSKTLWTHFWHLVQRPPGKFFFHAGSLNSKENFFFLCLCLTAMSGSVVSMYCVTWPVGGLSTPANKNCGSYGRVPSWFLFKGRDRFGEVGIVTPVFRSTYSVTGDRQWRWVFDSVGLQFFVRKNSPIMTAHSRRTCLGCVREELPQVCSLSVSISWSRDVVF